MFELTAQIYRIEKAIQTYESDTFSASAAKLTHTEIIAMLTVLLRERIRPGENCDGIALRDALREVRGQ